jgi:hypothetical protein
MFQLSGIMLNVVALCMAVVMPCQATLAFACSECAHACNCIRASQAGDSSPCFTSCCGESCDKEHDCDGLGEQTCMCPCHQVPSGNLPSSEQTSSSLLKLVKVSLISCLRQPKLAIEGVPAVSVISTCALFLSHQDACILFCRLVI